MLKQFNPFQIFYTDDSDRVLVKRFNINGTICFEKHVICLSKNFLIDDLFGEEDAYYHNNDGPAIIYYNYDEDNVTIRKLYYVDNVRILLNNRYISSDEEFVRYKLLYNIS